MATRVGEFLLNLFGVLNFRFETNQQKFRVSYRGQIISAIFFILYEVLVIKTYNERHFALRIHNLEFINVLSLIDLVNWFWMFNILYLDKLFRCGSYVKIMNRILKIENQCSSFYNLLKVNRMFYKYCFKFFAAFLIYCLLYAPFEYQVIFNQSFFKTFLDLTYIFGFIVLYVLNIFVEMSFFLKVKLHFVRVNWEIRVCGRNHQQLRKLFVLHGKWLEQVEDMIPVFAKMKLCHVFFVYISVPVYIFFMESGFSDYGSTGALWFNLYWLVVPLLMMGSCSVWAMPIHEVSFCARLNSKEIIFIFDE